MQTIQIKKAKNIKIEQAIENYTSKNYSATAITNEVNQFVKGIQQSQDVLSNLSKVVSMNSSTLQSNIPIAGKYIQQLELLKSKMTFGKETHSCKISFEWQDTIRRSKISSYNIDFEYFNAYYLLGTLHYMLAVQLTKENPQMPEEISKDITKHYRYAMFIFDKISNEAKDKINKEEFPLDLSPNYLQYLITLCMINAQTNLLDNASKKKMALETQPKLAIGISNLYLKAYNFSQQEPVKDAVDSSFRAYLYFQYYFYRATFYLKLREFHMKKFDDTGKGWGMSLFMQMKYVLELKEAQKYVSKAQGTHLVSETNFNTLLKDETERGTTYFNDNNRLYHETVPDENTEVPMEERIMISATIPPELAEISKDFDPNALDTLVSKEVTNMISTFKDKMSNLIKQNLDNNENEDKIKGFLASIGQLDKFNDPNGNKNSGANGIDDNLWHQISQIQQAGCMKILEKIMSAISNKSNELEKKLSLNMEYLKREQMDDEQQRNSFGGRWTRAPSNQMNGQLINELQKIMNNIRNVRQFDEKERQNVYNNTRFFDILTQTREQLNANIPKKISAPQPGQSQSKEEEELKVNIEKLNKLGQDLYTIISDIFADFNNDERYPPLFVNVLNSKTTEIVIFEQEKERFQKKFDELKNLSAQVKPLEQTISELNNKINMQKGPNNNTNNNNNDEKKYISDLFSYCQLFQNTYSKLNKGYSYYKKLDQDVQNIVNSVNQFCVQRNNEKKMLIQRINNQGSYMQNSNFSNMNQSGMGNSNYGMQGMNSQFSNMNFNNNNNNGNF